MDDLRLFVIDYCNSIAMFRVLLLFYLISCICFIGFVLVVLFWSFVVLFRFVMSTFASLLTDWVAVDVVFV